MGSRRQGRFRDSEQNPPSRPRQPHTGGICFLSLTDHPVDVGGGFEKCTPLGPSPGSLIQICWVVGSLYLLNPMRFACSQLGLGISAGDSYGTGGTKGAGFHPLCLWEGQAK